MNGGNMFSVVQAPKVSREAIFGKYGEDFAKVFDDCDGCIGVALDYLSDEERPKDMPAMKCAAEEGEVHQWQLPAWWDHYGGVQQSERTL